MCKGGKNASFNREERRKKREERREKREERREKREEGRERREEEGMKEARRRHEGFGKKILIGSASTAELRSSRRCSAEVYLTRTHINPPYSTQLHSNLFYSRKREESVSAADR